MICFNTELLRMDQSSISTTIHNSPLIEKSLVRLLDTYNNIIQCLKSFSQLLKITYFSKASICRKTSNSYGLIR
eukprot:UN00537